ncbi:MAG TPA: ABC transporter permease [Thermotogaceae bacterium]|nr:ABC transporter permease [Thermotogaceae bacterium]
MNEKKNVNDINKNIDELFEVEYLSRWRLILRAFKRHRLGTVSFWILVVFYLLAIFADFLSPYNPYEQSLTTRFAAPTKIRWTYKGKFVGPYVFPIMGYRDPVTYERYYVDASEIAYVKGQDSNGKSFEVEVGKNDVEKIVLMVEKREKAIGEKGEILLKRSSSEKNMIAINEAELIKNGITRFYDSNEDTIKIYTRNPMYSYKLKRVGNVKQILIERILKSLMIIKKDNNVEIIDSPKIEDFDFKIYRIKFFIRSWHYKLLWLIPTDVHFFGVDEPAKLYLFGSDKYGRDVWTRVLFGSRISLSIGFVGIAITFVLGLFLGGISGYFGGWIDEGMMRVTEVLMSIPSFYLLISLRAILPMDLPSTTTYFMLVVILSFIGWPGMSRVIRGMVLSIKQMEFVDAARAMGFPAGRIIWRHILPNTATYVIVAATLSIPGYILGEAGLSFLGLGIREPQSSWGLMLAQAQDITVLQHYPWLLIPGAFLFAAVLTFNLLGDALRDAFDPRSLGQ